jgi:hypothetical protein
MTGRWRRLRLFVVLGTLLLLVAYTGLDLWAGHRVNLAVARLEKQYGSLNEDTLRVAPAPAGDNRARVVRAAAALTALPPGTDRSLVSGAYYRFVQSPAPAPVPTDLRNFVAANRAAIRVADDVRIRRQSDWEVEYRYDGDRPPLMDMRTLSNAIYLAALMDLEAGRPEDAAKTIATGLAVSASLRQEGDLIVQLIRIVVGMEQCEAVHRVVIQSEPSRASLEELAAWLAENRRPNPARVALLSELKHVNAALTRLESGKLPGSGMMTELVRPSRLTRWYGSQFWLGPLARLSRPFIRLDRARYLQRVGDLLDVYAGPRPRPEFPSSAPGREAWLTRVNYMSSGLERSIDTFDRFNSLLGATELAVALRRFRLDHGTYPDELSALMPVYVANIPIDPFTGQPPVYARQGAGFHLRAQGGKNVPVAMVSALDWTVPK